MKCSVFKSTWSSVAFKAIISLLLFCLIYPLV